MCVTEFELQLLINDDLQAAKFGRGFLDLYNPTDFVNMGQTLKVLNAVRFYEIGIPLTYTQSVVSFTPQTRLKF